LGKGDETRQAIVEHALGLAQQVGLQGLTIGRLADDLSLSKSGLFAHFRSKESLQLQVLEAAAERFIDVVVRPALKVERGEPRVRALFEGWLAWKKPHSPRGCVFVQIAAELDDQEGVIRDRLVQMQRDWLDVIATAARGAVKEGHFASDVDVDQFAHDFYSVFLGYHHATQLFRDPRAEHRTRTAIDALISAARRH
jgi:AcrR family transcriptional regulator